jgi:ABC-type sugar transport system ATPase subunit
MENIYKAFPGVQALDNVSFRVESGAVHALVGENGAGKSTLMKLLSGGVRKDSGTIEVNGSTVEIHDPGHAQRLGISMIYQELTLIPYRNVGQNIFLGREPRKPIPFIIDWETLYARTQELLASINLHVDPRTPLSDLSTAQQQMVEVAKALSLDARIIIMDEPTSSLTDRETETLFSLIRDLRDRGITIIYISHRLEEVFSIADAVTVLRDGKSIDTRPVSELQQADIVRMMVGREVKELFPKESTPTDRVILEVDELSGTQFRDVSFELHAGEILGISGLVGAGRSEMARGLLGLDPITKGTVRVNGQTIPIRGIRQMMGRGFAYVPEDRKEQGLFLGLPVRDNLTISVLSRLFSFFFLSLKPLARLASRFVDRLNIQTPTLNQLVRNLSGGNQQKVIIARGLALEPRILVLDEPTRGIDVGAKAEIHGLMSRLASQGVGIIMISSELPEILGVSDRVLVMREGTVAGELDRGEATQDRIMHYAAAGGGQQ